MDVRGELRAVVPQYRYEALADTPDSKVIPMRRPGQ
jgi:hypothetical protein